MAHWRSEGRDMLPIALAIPASTASRGSQRPAGVSEEPCHPSPGAALVRRRRHPPPQLPRPSRPSPGHGGIAGPRVGDRPGARGRRRVRGIIACAAAGWRWDVTSDSLHARPNGRMLTDSGSWGATTRATAGKERHAAASDLMGAGEGRDRWDTWPFKLLGRRPSAGVLRPGGLTNDGSTGRAWLA